MTVLSETAACPHVGWTMLGYTLGHFGDRVPLCVRVACDLCGDEWTFDRRDVSGRDAPCASEGDVLQQDGGGG